MNCDFRPADFDGGGSAKENLNRDDLAISRKNGKRVMESPTVTLSGFVRHGEEV